MGPEERRAIETARRLGKTGLLDEALREECEKSARYSETVARQNVGPSRLFVFRVETMTSELIATADRQSPIVPELDMVAVVAGSGQPAPVLSRRRALDIEGDANELTSMMLHYMRTGPDEQNG